MKVGFLIDRWEPTRGGAERALTYFARHLIQRGHDVHAFGLSGSPLAPGEFHSVHVGGLTRARREKWLGRLLVDAAREHGCNLTIGIRHLPEVDFYWPHGGSHLRSLQARTEKSAPGIRGRHKVFLEFERLLLDEGGARKVVCVSDLVRRELAELHPASVDRLVVVPNGVDLEAFHPRNRTTVGRELKASLDLPDRAPLLVFAAARDAVQKGLPALLVALPQLLERPWHVLIAGHKRSPASIWRSLLRGIPPDRVTVRENVDPVRLFAAADLTVLPTRRDTSSFVVLESLASGTPVVTTRRAGAAEAIRTPEQGEVLDRPDDRQALIVALGRWIGLVSERAVDRYGVRAAVEDRGLAAWLDRLEAELLALAP